MSDLSVDFTYPEEHDEPAPVVRDEWIPAPLLTQCQQRFAVVPSGDVMTMPLLDKRLEVLRYALREAVESMDIPVIHKLAQKAIDTAARITAEQLAISTPGTRERIEDVIIHDAADRGKVIIHFSAAVGPRERRWLKICGFTGCGDGATYQRRRTFHRGENIALDHARTCIAQLLAWREKLTATQAA